MHARQLLATNRTNIYRVAACRNSGEVADLLLEYVQAFFFFVPFPQLWICTSIITDSNIGSLFDGLVQYFLDIAVGAVVVSFPIVAVSLVMDGFLDPLIVAVFLERIKLSAA